MNVLSRFCVALGFAVVAGTPAVAEPALWVAKSPTATVYLFGTIHVLPKNVDWRYPALDRALAASDSLYVEEDDSSRARIKALILEYGTSDADRADRANTFEGAFPHSDYVSKWHTLSRELGPEDRERLEIAAERAHLPGGVKTLEPMKPWLAALTLAVAATSRSGYEPQFGADTVLEHEFEDRGKPVHSFETTHDQIAFFAETPPALQMDLLRSVLENHAKNSAQVAALVQDWLAGNVAAIAAAVDGGMREQHPDLYKVLLVDRNRDWASRIAGFLTQRGTVFVAVGAAHLTGPDSVQAQLAKLGIRTERVH